MSMKNFVQEHYNELMEILNCIKVGVYIADSESNTILVNDESEKTGGMKREQLLNKSMPELIKMGYVEESSILKAIDSRREESIVQSLGEGGHLYITGVPVVKKGKVELVVCTERDITETMNLKELLAETEKMAVKFETELVHLKKQKKEKQGQIIAESAEMKAVVDKALRVANRDTTVMITGESGTGKELLANLIYENSHRKEKPFIRVNCAAIPENLMESELFGYEKGAFTGADRSGKMGIFELANNGTLFLDEIGELPIQMQSKLLRALQEKEIMRIGGKSVIPIDVRIIAATNVDLEEAILQGKFREDLYYRLNILPVVIPPLRERKADIEELANYFIEQFNREYGMNKAMTEDGLEELKTYHWPGNIRQLRNIIERIMVSFDGRFISRFQVARQLYNRVVDELPEPEKLIGKSLTELMEDYEKKILMELMGKFGTATKVAELLQVNKSTISRKLKKHGILLEEE